MITRERERKKTKRISVRNLIKGNREETHSRPHWREAKVVSVQGVNQSVYQSVSRYDSKME